MDKLNIYIKPDEKIWFTSDCHFGHRNILNFCERPFENTKEMEKAIIENWNSVVKPEEKVFCLGDFSWFHSRHEIKKIVNRLNGEIYMILGNHDKKEAFELCDTEKLHICSDITYLYLRPETNDSDNRFETNCYTVVLSHFPQLCYSQSEKSNTYNFFGHIHSRKDQPMIEFGEPIKLLKQRQYDIGMDRHSYTPIDFFDILKKIDEYQYWDLH